MRLLIDGILTLEESLVLILQLDVILVLLFTGLAREAFQLRTALYWRSFAMIFRSARN